ncbi:MAG: DUF4445 domain-containing protein [Armatimonadetes bacterium]|nr:DUF4445 domain-containing protein [Armatimonadota bacterium]
MAECTIIFLPEEKTITVPEGTTVLDAAGKAGYSLQTPCGGQGQCGKCRVMVEGPADAPKDSERGLLDAEEISAGWRLACQVSVEGDCTVTLPAASLTVAHRIMVEGTGREISVEPNVRKVSLRLSEPSNDDPRADLHRVLDAVSDNLRPPHRLAPLQSLPRTLRAHGYEVTCVIAGDELHGIEPGDTTDDLYGLAVDIGTTTVVAYLCHLLTGRVVAVSSDLNSQAQYGDDVISRIKAANSDEAGLAGLHRAIVAVINDLIERATHEAGLDRCSIYEVAIVGNTCMTHLFLGVPPTGLGTVPFVAAFRGPQIVPAADLGIPINPAGLVYVAPNIGSFVGADTIGVILASEIDATDGLRAAIDIGTNGEIVVAQGDTLLACSTAAGPAFEGARISRGMRASTGAIDIVNIDDDVHCHVIGDVEPRGLCGSALVDAIAELVRVGAIAETGRMIRPEEATGLPEKVARRLVENEDGMEFVLVDGSAAYDGEPIALTARDVRETQLAKAALYGGLELMLDQVGASFGDLDEFLLAGAFGNYIRRESAVAIGLIPAIDEEKIVSVGNAAGLGARLVLCSVEERRRAEAIAKRIRHVELSERQGFYDRFADAMMLRPLPEGGN